MDEKRGPGTDFESHRAIRNADFERELAAAVQAHRNGRFADALAAYDRAIVLAPQSVAAHYGRANLLSQTGRSAEGLIGYNIVIALKPDYAEAFNNRGNVLHDLKRYDESLASYSRAIDLEPNYAEAFSNRAFLLQELGRTDEALADYEQALRLRPAYPEALSNRSNLLHQLGRSEEALAGYAQAISLRPNYAEAFNNRGHVLHNLGRFEESLQSLDRAIALNPNYFQAHTNRGYVLHSLKRLEESVTSYKQAIALRPDYPEAYNNLGNVFHESKHLDEALIALDRAIALRRDYALAFYNRANVLRDMGRCDEALSSFDRAIAVNPNYAEAVNNRALLLHDLGRFDEALTGYDRAIALKPRYVIALNNRAQTRLLLGKFDEGWRDYEARLELKDQGRPELNLPHWKGESLKGRNILIHGEQGLGDVIQFCRYVPLLAEREADARVTLAVRPNLIGLLQRLKGNFQLLSSPGPDDRFELQCALLSLPLRFGTDLTTIPAATPYLSADPAPVARWRQKIGTGGFRIGICWHARPVVNPGRSFPLQELYRLASIPGVRLISLQKGDGIDQLSAVPVGICVETLGEDFDNGPDAFVDTAAVMENLDLVISCDTSIAHLAGALGKPALLALKYVPDWRWLTGRNDSPWYPKLRLYRQRAADDWRPVFDEIAAEVERRSAAGAGVRR